MSVTASRSWAHPWPGDASVRVVAGKRRSRCVPFAQDLWQRIGLDGGAARQCRAHPDDLGPIGYESGERLVLPEEGPRGRFGVYIPPLMEALGFAEVTHEAKGNRMRVKQSASGGMRLGPG